MCICRVLQILNWHLLTYSYYPFWGIGRRQGISKSLCPGLSSLVGSRSYSWSLYLPPVLGTMCFLVCLFSACPAGSMLGLAWWCYLLAYVRYALSISNAVSWFSLLPAAGLFSAIVRRYWWSLANGYVRSCVGSYWWKPVLSWWWQL